MISHDPVDLLDLAGFASHATVRKAQVLHEFEVRTIAIKASPPVFKATVTGIYELLDEVFAAAATPVMMEAASELADLHFASLLDFGTSPEETMKKALDIVEGLEENLAKAGQNLSDDDVESFGRYLAAAYRLGQAEVAKPLGWAVAFNMVDRDAIHGLRDAGLFWVGEHYGKALEATKFRDELQSVMLEQGLGRREAGRRLAELFGDQIQRSQTYWRGFAAVVTTRARSFGALEAMNECGGLRYEYVNPLDERTSDVCRRLDGKVFSVSGGIKLRDELLTAKTPEDWKKLAPWPKVQDLTVDGSKAGKLLSPGALQSKGIAWPPLHFHCRSSIQIRVWAPLGKGDADPLGDVELKNLKPPVKKPKPVTLPDVIPEPVGPPPWTLQTPAAMKSPDVDMVLGDWKALMRLNGYTEDEIKTLINTPAVFGDDLDFWDAVYEPQAYDELIQWLGMNPPAKPRTWNLQNVMDPLEFEAWMQVNDSLPTADKEELVSVMADWLTGRGYTEDEAFALIGWDPKMKMSTGLIAPEEVTWLELAEVVEDHPPTKLGADILGEAIPPAAPLPTPSTPVVPPVAPATTAAELGGTVGAVEVPATYGWTVPKLPNGVVGTKSKTSWAKWLKTQGYTQEEVDEILDDLLASLPEDPKTAGAWMGLTGGKKVSAKAGAWRPHAVAYLESRPPGKVLSFKPSPATFLGPEELGDRLTKSPDVAAPDIDLGEAWTDSVSGEVWFVKSYQTEKQARQIVAADSIYRKLGMEVPTSRVVRIDGKLAVARKRFTGWQTKTVDDMAAEELEELAATMPADAFLGNWNVAGANGNKFRVRVPPTAGSGRVLRIDNAGVLDFRATGGLKPGGGLAADKVDELDSLLNPQINSVSAKAFARASDDPSKMLPMMDKVAELSDQDIRGALKHAGLTQAAENDLAAKLIGRRDAMRKRAKMLRDEVANRAAEDAAREARRLERLAAAGTRKPMGSGLNIAKTDYSSGTVLHAGDADKIADQYVRSFRYKMRGAGHEGFALELEVAAGHRDRVSRAMKAAGGKGGSYRNYSRHRMLKGDDSMQTGVMEYVANTENRFFGEQALRLDSDAVQIDYMTPTGKLAARGRLRVLVKTSDPKEAQRALASALRSLELEDALKVPTKTQREVYLANRALWNIEGGGFTPVKTAADGRRRLKAHGLSVQDLVVEDNGAGDLAVRIPGRWERYRKKNGVQYLVHDSPDDEGVLESMAGANLDGGGITSTIRRTERSLVRRGQSSGDDMNTGGAHSAFTRLVKAGHDVDGMGGSRSRLRFIVAPSELDRVDFYAHNFDNYGRTADSYFATRATADAVAAGQTAYRNEVMFRGGIAADRLLLAAAPDAQTRTAWLQRLRSAGVTEVAGQPVEKWVVVMRSGRDYSNFDRTDPVHRFIMGLDDIDPTLE